MALPSGPIAWSVACFAIGAAGTWLARRYALARDLVDQPGERRSHVVATPRGGGIAIVASVVVAMAWLALAHAVHLPTIGLIAAGLLLVAGIGWIDDHRPMSPWTRLAVQAVAAGLVAGALLLSGRAPLPAAFGFAVVLVLVNVWNFMDGIDGLAASQALLVAAGWAWIGWPDAWAWLLLAVAAGCLGFLPFNLPRARIFLGDVGSGSVGYLLAIGLLWLPADALGWPWLASLPLSAFLVDATLTLARRILNGDRWWTPHLQHAYQRWAGRRRGHGAVTAAYALWTACAVVTMVLARGAGTVAGAVALGTGYVAAAATWAWIRRDRTTQEGSGQS